MTQVVECLPSKNESLSSNPSIPPSPPKKEKEDSAEIREKRNSWLAWGRSELEENLQELKADGSLRKEPGVGTKEKDPCWPTHLHWLCVQDPQVPS
jgi:hypothetical protein